MLRVSDAIREKTVRSWCLYDWANSAFATTIMAAVLPTYYRTVAGAHLEGNLATSYWGYTVAFSMLMIAFSAPILGAIADHSGAKKKMLGFFTLLGVFATALLYLVRTGDWKFASLAFILGNLGFAGGIIFYDSLLPHIARPKDIDMISTMGYALGYLGGGILLAINLMMIMRPAWFGLPDAEMAVRVSFLTVAVWWGVFSIPLFRNVKEPPHDIEQSTLINPVKGGLLRLRKTFREIRAYRELVKFIIAFWLYNDGIGTIIKMATIYGSEIGIGTTDLIGALLMTQFIGIPCSLLFGKMAKRVGTKHSIHIGLGVYILISIGGFFMTQAWHFWVMAGCVGLVQGGCQALSRSLFGVMAPRNRSAEFFGFYEVSSKFAGIVGPFLFAFIGHLTGTSRFGILSLILLFGAGSLLLTRVNVQEGMSVAREQERLAGIPPEEIEG